MSSMKPGEITVFVVPGTGIELPIRKVSYKLVQDIQRQILSKHPEPKAPVQPVDYGNGVVEYEPNYAHPDYVAALDRYKGKINEETEEATTRLLIKFGVLPFIEWNEDRAAEVAALRKMMQEEFGAELDADDRYVWVTRIAMGDIEDWTDFTMAMMRRSQATQAGVEEAVKKF